MRTRTIIGHTLALLVLFDCAYASENADRRHVALAQERGCMLCHALRPDDRAVQQVLPLAPSFEEIAQRYRGDASAEKRLVRTVLQGTGPHPGDRHWAGKVDANRMLPNAVEIDEPAARSLVRWILSLEAPRS